MRPTYHDIFIGQAIKRLREARGIRQKQLGLALDFSESYISFIESGKRTIGSKDIRKLNRFFGVDIYEMVFSLEASPDAPPTKGKV